MGTSLLAETIGVLRGPLFSLQASLLSNSSRVIGFSNYFSSSGVARPPSFPPFSLALVSACWFHPVLLDTPFFFLLWIGEVVAGSFPHFPSPS